MHAHCRWVDSEGNHKFKTFIPEVERPADSHDDTAADLLPGRGDQPKRVLCIMSSAAKYGNGLPISVVCSGIIHLRR